VKNVIEMAEVYLGEKSESRRAVISEMIKTWVADGGDINMRDGSGDSAIDFCNAEWLNKTEKENSVALRSILVDLGAE